MRNTKRVLLLGGPENGISNIEAPFSSLIGVFLSNSQPSASAAPAMLNYNSSVSGYNTSKDAATYSPLLQQVFFIGDGKTGSTVQSFIAPADATRLFIGVMDTYEWSNNAGGFKVAVSSVPVPGALWLLGSGLIGPRGLSAGSSNNKVPLRYASKGQDSSRILPFYFAGFMIICSSNGRAL